jgi:hypothetical protein
MCYSLQGPNQKNCIDSNDLVWVRYRTEVLRQIARYFLLQNVYRKMQNLMLIVNNSNQL